MLAGLMSKSRSDHWSGDCATQTWRRKHTMVSASVSNEPRTLRAAHGRSGGTDVGVGSSTPLSHGEVVEAAQVAERLHDAVRTLLGALPREARSASGLAKFVGVERTICQRLLGAFSAGRVDAAALTRIPGSKGLHAITDALQRRTSGRGHDVPARELAMLDAACRQVEEIYLRFGGNKQAFGERLLLSQREPKGMIAADALVRALDGSGAGSDRRQLFEIARGILGRWSATTVQVLIYAPSKENPDRIDVVRIRGQSGVQAREGAVAWIAGAAHQGSPNGGAPEFTTLDGRRVPARGESLLLREFCSDPAPVIDTIEKPGFLGMVVNAPPSVGDHGYDLMLGDQSPAAILHPRLQNPSRGHEVMAIVEHPTEALLCEVYWHRDLARLFIPEADVHFAHRNIGELVDQRWMTRLDEKVRMEVLSSGRSAPASGVYPRHAELVTAAFGTLGWDREQFVGYRIEERLPLWRMGYRMYFDYVGGE